MEPSRAARLIKRLKDRTRSATATSDQPEIAVGDDDDYVVIDLRVPPAVAIEEGDSAE